MLRSACRRFRAELTPGDPHLRSCGACAAYAAAMERAANRVPLPARLESKLRAIPGVAAGGPRLPLPQAPLPDGLRSRLRGVTRQPVPRPASRQLPPWVRSSRYAIAASYLMAVLIGSTLGNPADLGQEAADALSRLVIARLDQAFTEVRSEGAERLGTWKESVRERIGETRRSLEDSLMSSLDNLGDRAAEMSQTVRFLDPLTNRGPRREPAGPQGE
ncbi:MAG TPA: hypothetical protein VE078_06680 [Thermoanaerobaculia bacterium]|nr:hypothetical protein [Thermoanaerobaculia bacterium]